MKVKVIKANLSSYWYANNIGKVYDVEEVRLNNHSNLEYKVIGSELSGTKYFDKDDVEIIKEKKEMKLSDLKTGMRVVHGKHPRHFDTYGIVVRDLDKIVFNSPDGWNTLGGSYREDLKGYSSCWDITEIYAAQEHDLLNFNVAGKLLWKREEKSQAQLQLEKLQEQIAQLTKEADTLKGVLDNK